jgi:hypothetical protein
MKKFFNILWVIYTCVAEIVGTFIIIMFILSLFGHGKFEVGHGNWQQCFGDCQKVEQNSVNPVKEEVK